MRNGKVIDNGISSLSNGVGTSSDEHKEEHILMEDGKKEDKEEKRGEKKEVTPTLHKTKDQYIPPIPFPSRLKEHKQDKQFSELCNMLSKVQINLPLLDMIRNVPSYAKIFKYLCTRKMRYDVHEKVIVSEVVSWFCVITCHLN